MTVSAIAKPLEQLKPWRLPPCDHEMQGGEAVATELLAHFQQCRIVGSSTLVHRPALAAKFTCPALTDLPLWYRNPVW